MKGNTLFCYNKYGYHNEVAGAMPIFNYKVVNQKGNTLKGTCIAPDAEQAALKLRARNFEIIELEEATSTARPVTDSSLSRRTTDLSAIKEAPDAKAPRPPADSRTSRPTMDSRFTRPPAEPVPAPPSIEPKSTRSTYDSRFSRPATESKISRPSMDSRFSRRTTDLSTGLSGTDTARDAVLPREKASRQTSPSGAVRSGVRYGPRAQPGTKLFADRQALFLKYQISGYDLLICTRQLQQMVSAGLPIVKAMTALEENQSNQALRHVLGEINADVQRGMSLTASFSRFPEVFPPTYLAMIRVGEATGNLDASLKNIAALLERDHEMRTKITASLTYPCFIFGVASILMVVIVFYFVPVFMNVFEQLHLTLPLPTMVLLFLVKAFRRIDVIILLLLLFVLATLLFSVYSKKAAFRMIIDDFKLSIPFIGDTIILITLGRLLNSMAIMLRSGVPLLKTISILISSTNLMPLKNALLEMDRGVKDGAPISSGELDPRFFSVLFRSFVSAGEESGSLPFMLESLARMYDENINSRLDTLVNLMEPVLLTVISFVIGFILISIFLPLYGVLNSFT